MRGLHRRLVFLGLLVATSASVSCGGKGGLSVSEVSPNKGPHYGDNVYLHGSGFKPTAGVSIYFGDKKAKDYLVESDSKIRVFAPAHPVCAVVDIKLVFDDATSIMVPKAYTYIDPLAPFLGLTKEACASIVETPTTAAAKPQAP
jgi:hypothetical protein